VAPPGHAGQAAYRGKSIRAGSKEAIVISVVKINALTVSEEMRAELERRFGARAGLVEGAEGFEHFELLRPLDGTDRYLVYTRWRSEEDFQRWMQSQAFQRGHREAAQDGEDRPQGHGHGHGGPAASAAEVWSFEVIQSAAPKPAAD
jgi:heme oxygenase (mycobilin-producing)